MSRPSRPRFPVVRLTASLVLAFLVVFPTVFAQQLAPADEYEVKAAYLVKFARFVEWPGQALPSTNSPIVIGVLGENPFGAKLEAMTHAQTVAGRPLRVRFVETPEDATRCHILFVASSERRLASRITGQAPAAVLTVGESEGFVERGGVIQFTLENNRVRFLINPDAAQRANLRLSAKLLGVASAVVRDRRGETR